MSHSVDANLEQLITGPIELIPVRMISQENIQAIKTSNDAAMQSLQAAMDLLESLDQDSLEPIKQNVSDVQLRTKQAKLFVENFRRSTEEIKEFVQWNNDLKQNPLRRTVLTHLNEALTHSEEIDYKLCPLNNDEQLYSSEMGVTIDEILKHI